MYRTDKVFMFNTSVTTVITGVLQTLTFMFITSVTTVITGVLQTLTFMFITSVTTVITGVLQIRHLHLCLSPVLPR